MWTWWSVWNIKTVNMSDRVWYILPFSSKNWYHARKAFSSIFSDKIIMSRHLQCNIDAKSNGALSVQCPLSHVCGTLSLWSIHNSLSPLPVRGVLDSVRIGSTGLRKCFQTASTRCAHKEIWSSRFAEAQYYTIIGLCGVDCIGLYVNTVF
jgi:hypothetical protein